MRRTVFGEKAVNEKFSNNFSELCLIKRHRQAGFTLVELMLVVLISGIILAGAFQVEISFHRAMAHQENISELQSSLDTLQGFLTKHLSYIGVGLGSTVTYHDCNQLHTGDPPVMIHNLNDWNPPRSDLNEGNLDYDPDWIEFIEMAGYRMLDGSSTSTKAAVYSTRAELNGNYNNFRIGNTYSVMAYTFNGRTCLFRVTRLKRGNNSAPYSFWAYYSRSGVWGCMNKGTVWSTCFPGSGSTVTPSQPFLVTFLGRYPVRALRVETRRYSRPMLMLGYRPMYSGTGRLRWYPAVEGIEDMQVAYHLDLSNPMDGRGDLWINTRDLRPSEYGRVVALRLSFVIRSANPTAKIPSRRPALEDRPAGSLDRYVRRTMTMVVKLRTKPQMGGQL